MLMSKNTKNYAIKYPDKPFFGEIKMSEIDLLRFERSWDLKDLWCLFIIIDMKFWTLFDVWSCLINFWALFSEFSCSYYSSCFVSFLLYLHVPNGWDEIVIVARMSVFFLGIAGSNWFSIVRDWWWWRWIQGWTTNKWKSWC